MANRKQRRRKAQGSGASRTTAGASGARTPAPAAPVPDLPDEHLGDDGSYVLVRPDSLTELAWLIEEPGPVLEKLELLGEMRTLLREAERTLVGLGRQQGYSWGRLATPLHRSRQSLHEMHAPHVGGWGGAPVEPVSR